MEGYHNDADEERDPTDQPNDPEEIREDEGEDAGDIRGLIEEGFRAVLEELAVIEELLSPTPVEQDAESDEGDDDKKEDDEAMDALKARIAAVYQKTGNVSKPCARRTLDAGDKAKEVKDAFSKMKQVFPDISKYYEN